MPEISTIEAGQIIGLSRQSIYVHIKSGRLKAKQVGPRRVSRIEVDELRRLAEKYNYRFDEELATKFAK